MVANQHAAIHWGATLLLKNRLWDLRDSPNVENIRSKHKNI